MKTLANCTPREFLAQTVKIKDAVANWLDKTKIMEIRKNLPKISKNATKEENDAAYEAQVKANLSAMIDSALAEHPDETLEILALVCFTDPAEIDDLPMSYFLGAIAEVLSCPEVVNFFVSLVRLDSTPISDTAKV